MAFTTVITHATGDVFPAADWNTYIRDNINYLGALGDLSGQATLLNGTVSYSAPAGTNFLEVEGIGGGGGGAGAGGSAGLTDVGGGGGGGTWTTKLVSANIGTHTVAIGAGGAAGAAGGGTSGSGGQTSFNDSVGTTVLTAPGGQGSTNIGANNFWHASSLLNAGGAGVGDLSIRGDPGEGVRVGGSAAYSRGGAAARGGGGGQAGADTSGSAAGSTGFQYGGGAAGAVAIGATSAAGAAGFAGVMRIRVYG
jgi:hypothetical protein